MGGAKLIADLKVFPQRIVNIKVREKPELESLPEVASELHAATKALRHKLPVICRITKNSSTALAACQRTLTR